MLPEWIADLQVLETPELARRCVEWLPLRLRCRCATLYTFEVESKQFRLLASSASVSTPLTIAADDQSSPVVIATRARATEATSTADGVVWTLPLHDEQECRGALQLAFARHEQPATDELAALGAFLGRAMTHAARYEAATRDARRDALTGLFNFRWLIETLEREVRRAARYGAPLSVIMIDLDRLKQINDQRGHAVGDQVLRRLADAIHSNLRRFDAGARRGGDEFAVVLPSTELTGAVQVAHRIGATLADTEDRGIGASLGVAQWRVGWSAQKLLEAADAAMYAAKQSRSTGEGVRVQTAANPSGGSPAGNSLAAFVAAQISSR